MTGPPRARLRIARLSDLPADRTPAEPPRWHRVVALVLCAGAVLAAARGLARHNTWYLASDQFAFLTFADDLAHGAVFHDPAVVELLAGPTLPRDVAADAYYQTYIFRDGRLFSRYPPGFPLMLAAAGRLGGEPLQHALNPLLYLVLVALVGRLAARLSPDLGLAAAATATWALLVIPAEVHYWGLTVARDLPAHLLALAALACALAARPTWAGLLLGIAACVRPDAVLWGPSVGWSLPRATRRLREVALAGAAFLAGAAPLFAYNTLTQGHPLAFTQGSEFRGMLESALGVPAMLAVGVDLVSGGAFRLVNFPATFAVHAAYLLHAFGAFLPIAIGAAIVPSAARGALARALAPYAVGGLLFYSCWSHGDPRYLVGVSLCLILLAAAGITRLAARLADPATSRAVRLGGLAVAVALLGAGLVLPRDPARGLTTLERVAAVALVGAAATPIVGRGRQAAALFPALALAAFGVARMAGAAGSGTGFGAADVARARAAVAEVVPAGALVLTSPALGRPAENWTHYTGASASYVAELPRLLSSPSGVARRCAERGRPLFLLLPAGEPPPLGSADGVVVQDVARRGGVALRDWFVDPERARAGAVLYEVTPRRP